MRTMKMLMGSLAGLLLAACAGHRTVMGEQTLVERIPPGDMPKWVGVHSPDFVNDKMSFYGVANTREDMQLCVREAEAGAKKFIAGKLLQNLSNEFQQSMERGSQRGTLGAFVGDYFRSRTENVQVSGVAIDKQMVEVKKERIREGVRYVYDCHVLTSISRLDYDDARSSILSDIRGRASVELDKKAREAFERVMEKLDARTESTAGR